MSNPKSLTDEEIKSYQNDGFTKCSHKVFTDDDYAAFKKVVYDVLKNNGYEEKSKVMRAPHLEHPEFLFWLLSDNVLDLAVDVLGENVGMASCSIFFKKAHTLDKAYWHKDSNNLFALDLYEDKNLLNLIISFSECNLASGCLYYAPGTHLKKLDHTWVAPANDLIEYSLAIDEKEIDLNSIRHLELKENEASLHNVNVVHGSEPNQSDHDRIILSCRFFSASKRCNLENFRKNGIWPLPFLVRGHDSAGSGLKSLKLDTISQ
jgi:hypothetical protein